MEVVTHLPELHARHLSFQAVTGESPCWDYIAAIVEIATSFTVRAMSSEKSKREVPGGLKAVLEKDVKLSKEFVELVNRKYPIAAYRSHLKSLEVRTNYEA